MRERILTAALLAPLVLICSLVRTPYPLFLVCLLTTTLGFWELRQLTRNPKTLPVVTLFGLVVPFYGTEVQANRDATQVILYCAAFWVVGLFFTYRVTRNVVGTSVVDLAGLWVAMPMSCILMVHKLCEPGPHGPPHSLFYHAFLLLILVPVWIGDIGALFIGKRFGKHPLWRAVSPNKSWEGAIANLVLCVVTSGLLVKLLDDPERLPLHLLCGGVIGVVGQAGDLFESYVKRTANVKDSGSILPGHGGILDRIDSLLFVAPIVSVILVLAFGSH